MRKGEETLEKEVQAVLKNLPKIDEVMNVLEKRGAYARTSRDVVKTICRSVVESMRREILEKKQKKKNGGLLREEVIARVEDLLENLHAYSLRKVVNATGVILHTNLGRAPLCHEALMRLVEIGGGYSNLEFDLSKGQRGDRYEHVRNIFCTLTGAQDVIVVNNNAAAVLLVLNTIAENKEVIVSRGELVEIGGEFRIPEVMKKSGACLREVGTTNRTRLSDYEEAIGPHTGLILKVHTSNFRIVGFTEAVDLSALVELGKKYGLPVMNDLGSGCFIELNSYGLEREPTISEVLRSGVDVVTFSGDKLLGGPQAGIILGSNEVLSKVRKNPLNRALRIDKLTLAALEGTLHQYLQPEKALTTLRSLKSLTEPLASVKNRARKLRSLLVRERLDGVSISIKKGSSMAGGGSLPAQTIETFLIGIVSSHMSPATLDERLKSLDVPIVARISEDEVLLDLRTIAEDEFSHIVEGLKKICLL